MLRQMINRLGEKCVNGRAPKEISPAMVGRLACNIENHGGKYGIRLREPASLEHAGRQERELQASR